MASSLQHSWSSDMVENEQERDIVDAVGLRGSSAPLFPRIVFDAHSNQDFSSGDLVRSLGMLFKLTIEDKEFLLSLHRSQPFEAFQSINIEAHRQRFLQFATSRIQNNIIVNMVIGLCCIFRDRTKILEVLRSLIETRGKESDWPIRVHGFIDTFVTQHPWEMCLPGKGQFAIPHMPLCFPEIDILCWALCIPIGQLGSLDGIKTRLSFTQIRLNKEMQQTAKEGFQSYWATTMSQDPARHPRNGRLLMDLYTRDGHYDRRSACQFWLIDMNGLPYRPPTPPVGKAVRFGDLRVSDDAFATASEAEAEGGPESEPNNDRLYGPYTKTEVLKWLSSVSLFRHTHSLSQ